MGHWDLGATVETARAEYSTGMLWDGRLAGWLAELAQNAVSPELVPWICGLKPVVVAFEAPAVTRENSQCGWGVGC